VCVRESAVTDRLLPDVRNQELAAAADSQPMKALVFSRAENSLLDSPGLGARIEDRDSPTIAMLA
jgi:hypothetical protein